MSHLHTAWVVRRPPRQLAGARPLKTAAAAAAVLLFSLCVTGGDSQQPREETTTTTTEKASGGSSEHNNSPDEGGVALVGNRTDQTQAFDDAMVLTATVTYEDDGNDK